MKPYSLRFLSDNLETEYQEYNIKRYQNVFNRNLLFFGCVALGDCLYAFIIGQWQVGIYCFCFSSIVPTLYFMARKGPIYFEFCCFIFQASLALCVMILYFLKLIKLPLQDADSYITGQSLTFVMLSFNLGSQFKLKFIVVILNVFAQLSQILAKNQITLAAFFWLGSNLIILNYIYWHDRILKEAFLIKQNEKLWQQEIGSFAQISIFTCVSDQAQLDLDLNKCNKKSQDEFNISDKNSFKLFLNSVKLIPKHKFTQQILRKMKQKKLNVQSKNFTLLHSKIYNISQQFQSNNSEYYCYYNDTIYDIRIFTTWSDQLLNIHTLMSKSLIQVESEAAQRIKIERKLFTQYRQEILSTIKMIFVKVKSFDFQESYSKIHGSVMSDLQNALRYTTNIQLSLVPQYEQNQTIFFLQPLIEKIITVTKNWMPNQYHLNINCQVDAGLKLQSCQKTIFQILLNLLSIVVRPAKKSGYIMLTATEKENIFGSDITFSIATNIQSATNLINIQNYHKDIYDEKMGFNHNNNRIGLEMNVSRYLVGKIGPNRRINFIDFSQDKQIICFNIHKNLDSFPD